VVAKANRIVVAVDSSPISDAVMREAAAIGQALASDVYVVSVVPMSSFAMSESDIDRKEAKSEGDSYVAMHKALMEKHFPDSKLLVESKVFYGDPVKKICEFAEAANARLIVLGNRGMGHLQALFLGSTSEGVLRGAKTSVLVVK